MTLPVKRASPKDRPLWACPLCGRQFANVRQSHSCAPPVELAAHFRGRDPAVYRMYEEILALVRRCGPVTVLAEKTRIAFQVRMSFMALSPRQMHIRGHFVFARRVPNRRFQKIETISPRNHVHHFCIENSSELDAEFAGWIQEAYAVGGQEHLVSSAGSGEAATAEREKGAREKCEEDVTDWKRLFAYDAWANREVLASLETAGTVAPEKAWRRMGHIVGAQRLWLARIEAAEGEPPGVWPELPAQGIGEALGELARRWAALVTGLDEAELTRPVTYVNSKRQPWSSAVGDILMHVVLHGGYHRGQIASDLRDAGATPAYTDYIEAVRRGWI